MNTLINPKFQATLLLTLGLITYFPVISSSTNVNPDAQFIIPFLESATSITDYFNKLVHFNTLDFQPIRDLSLYLDLKTYSLFGINISVFHNVIIWCFSLWPITRILKHIFHELSELEVFLICCSFVVYPLFTATVSWGMARKHLLSFFFVMLATEKLLKPRKEFTTQDSIYMMASYSLAILSQPISLFWGPWAALYGYILKPEAGKSRLKIALPGIALFIAGTIINFLYYSNSTVFLGAYSSKTNELFEFSDKILALGHYIFQLFFPYLLSFSYTLGHWSTLAGLGVLGLFAYLILGMRIGRKKALLWTFFSLFPLGIILSKSSMIYDTYLLLPGFGVLILLLLLKERLPNSKYKYSIYAILIISWTTYSHLESKAWSHEINLTKKSFEHRPSCNSASDYLRISYENGLPPKSDEARKFLYQNECEKFQPQGVKLLNLKANMLYYESDLPIDQRISNLQRLSKFGVFPSMAYAAFLVKQKKEADADEAISTLLNQWGPISYKDEYIPIAAEVLAPYCKNRLRQECLNFLKPFLQIKKGLSYK